MLGLTSLAPYPSADLHRIMNLGPHLVCVGYKIVKATPCGYWIKEIGNGPKSPRRWIAKRTRGRIRPLFACATFEEALESFVARKKWEGKKLSERLDDVAYAQREAEAMLGWDQETL